MVHVDLQALDVFQSTFTIASERIWGQGCHLYIRLKFQSTFTIASERIPSYPRSHPAGAWFQSTFTIASERILDIDPDLDNNKTVSIHVHHC